MNRNIFITGSNGFVGKNFLKQFEDCYTFSKYEKGDAINISQSIVIHLAGKAHDLKNVTDPSEYYIVNTELTKSLFDKFIESDASVFITLSSVKAVADDLNFTLTENHKPNPKTHYGKSKLLAENYILSHLVPAGKRFYILRPCMIHGPGNKGNLNLLFKIVEKGWPWPLGSYENQRSFCSIDNLCFIINELILNKDIPSGIYNIADDEPLCINMIIELISKTLNKKIKIWRIPKFLIKMIANLGDIIKLPLNSERLNKLTESYIVSNSKIKNAINKSLPLSSKVGMIKTLDSFVNL